MPIYPDLLLLIPGQKKAFTFQVIYKCETYCFCECRDNASLRGFFTRQFVETNKWPGGIL